MGNRDYLILQETESQKAPLSVCFTQVLSGERKSAENPLRVREVNAMLAEVRAPLRGIPCKSGQE